MPPATSDEAHPLIAIVGLACRFPGDASSPSKFWDLLRDGRDAFSSSTDRYNEEAFYHPIGNDNRRNVLPSKGGHFLKQDPYVFDVAFFNITAAEAIALSTKQRIALEVAYEALENAGMTLQKVAGTQTACFMGTSGSDYRDAVSRDFANYPKYHLLGTSEEMLSNRISHFLDIHGPSATIQTACSSSHVATHLACQSIQLGESDMAIAGGVVEILGPECTMHLNNLGFLSPVGHSKSFDEDADGYGRGEGCGVLLLKRLDNAIRDGDAIRAVIRASGVNSGGWTQGVTMPSGDAQATLIKHVYESNDLEYGLTQVWQQPGSLHNKLCIGSVKQNVGHLEAAAGMASIIKGVLSMEHGLIPPNIRFSKPNPAIPLDEWNMTVLTKLSPWPICQKKRMSVSGFGMGGTNAHLVLEEFKYPAALQNGTGYANRKSTIQTSRKRLFVFSSHDQAGFKRIGNSFTEYLDNLGPAASSSEYLDNLAHTLATARSGLSWKDTCLVANMAELREQLVTTLGNNANRASGHNPPRIGFVFTGQGAQWARMGVEMLGRPVFSDSMARSAEYLRGMGCDWDPVTELSKTGKQSRLGVPEISQPICSVLQIALVDELRSWNIEPAKVVGHSSGEIAAAYCVGALTHRDALAAAYFRGKASASLKPGKGGMLAAGCSRENAQDLINKTKLPLTVACVNSPSSVTFSGDASALEELQTILEERGVFARRLKVDVAYHSYHMNSCIIAYATSIADLDPRPTAYGEDQRQEPIIMICSVTASEVDPELLGPYYWIRNLVSPVLFADAVKEMVNPADVESEKSNAVDLLIEIGPHRALGGPIEQLLSHHAMKNVGYMSVLTRGENTMDTSLNLASELFRLGVPIDVPRVNGDSHCRLLTNLPSYPWNHSERFRADSRIHREHLNRKFPTKSILGALLPRMEENEHVWRSFIRLDDEPWLRDHTVGNTVLLPAACMISIAIEATQQMVDPGKTPSAFKLRDVSFMAMITLSENVDTEVTLQMRPHMLATTGPTAAAWWEFTISSCAGATGQLRNNCRGLLTIVYKEQTSLQMAHEDVRIHAARITEYRNTLKEYPDVCSNSVFYEQMAKSGFQFGEIFQNVDNCHLGHGKNTFKVRIADIGETFSKDQLDRPFLIHATTLDVVFQGWVGSVCTNDNNGTFGFDKFMLPAALGELEISVNIPTDGGYKTPCLSHSRKHGFTEWSASMTMFDKELSEVFLSITDYRISEVDMKDVGELDREKVIDIDPANIATKVHWNYALDTLDKAEIAQVVSDAAPTTIHDWLIELIRLAIHQRPAVHVIELVADSQDISNATISRLPRNMVLPSQIHYASTGNNNNNDDNSGNIYGYAFEVDLLDPQLPTSITPADLLIIPHQVSNTPTENLGSTLEHLSQLAGADANIIISATSSSFSEEIASPLLESRGFQLVSFIPVGADCLAFFRSSSKEKQPSEKLTNGTQSNEVVILEPSVSSTDTQSFSKKLQVLLEDQDHHVSAEAWSNSTRDSVCSGRTYISLLELKQPMFGLLSEIDFQNLRTLIMQCERILWITCGDNPLLGIIDGFARTMNNENVGARFQILHLSSEGARYGPSLAARILCIPSDSGTMADAEFREKGGLLQVARAYRSLVENESIRNHLYDSTQAMSLSNAETRYESEPLRLTIGRPGLLDTLHFVPGGNARLVPPGDHEIELQVKAAGVNFRDIMGAMALFPIQGLGQEASGVVLRTGSIAAKLFKPGDRVNALSLGGAFATSIKCDCRVAQKLPETMSFEDAAAVPVIYTTAYYALVKLAKLQQGQSVLIHAAAGGLGQAAMQLARHLGIVTYVTVGTEDKRQLIIEHYGIPDEHIFNSRDSSFVKGIERVTGGRGVHCILNSLSGELLRASFGCLATFGTFVEVGLRDITNNMRLDMRPFIKSTTFTFLNVHTLVEEDPTSVGEILSEVLKLLHRGFLSTPLPLTVYPVGKVEEAFRAMQQGKHRGKMVLSFTESNATSPVLCKAKDSLKLKADVTYLIVGGLGGLGRSLALELVASGARHIAVISQSGDTKSKAKKTIRELTARGAQVKVYRGDVADENFFLDAMEECSKQLPPIKGVIQMAMVLRDVVFEKMTYEEWTIPLRPKVSGSWNLHEYFSHKRPLDFMIFCSSIAGVFGNPGQANYAAGNTYQDALAYYRRAQGLKAVSVDLGIMRDVGVIAEQGAEGLKLWEEVLGIREPVFHALMKSLINSQLRQRRDDIRSEDDRSCPVQVCVGLGTADLFATHGLGKPHYFNDVRFGPLAVATVSSATSEGVESGVVGASLASRLSEAGNNNGDRSRARAVVVDALVSKTAEILRIPPSEVDPGKALYQYGVDSLVALEVRNWIAREMKANMALLEILAAMPMVDFAEKIAQKSQLVKGAA